MKQNNVKLNCNKWDHKFPRFRCMLRRKDPHPKKILSFKNAKCLWELKWIGYIYVLWKDAFFHNWYLFLKNSILFMKVCSILLFYWSFSLWTGFWIVKGRIHYFVEGKPPSRQKSIGFTFGMEHFLGRSALLRLG